MTKGPKVHYFSSCMLVRRWRHTKPGPKMTSVPAGATCRFCLSKIVRDKHVAIQIRRAQTRAEKFGFRGPGAVAFVALA